MNDFVPSRVHHVWSVFALALLFIFLFKAIAEYFGSTLIQYVGLSAVTDLRNKVYSKVVQQPVGFFHHNPVGRVMSAVISDIEQLRSAFSDYMADFFRQFFNLIAFVSVLLLINWRMAIGSAVLVPLVVWPVAKLTRRIRAFHRKKPLSPRRSEPDTPGNDQRKPRGESLRHGRLRDSEIPRRCPKLAARKTCAGFARWPPPDRSWTSWAR